MKEFLESKDTFKKVLKTLKNELGYSVKKIEVEDEFFICGGSVANTLYSMVHGGEPIINDIDVFTFKKDILEYLNGWDSEVVDDEVYNFRFTQKHNSSYKILTETKKGLLNIIECDVTNNSQKRRVWHELEEINGFNTGALSYEYEFTNQEIILNGFDLNCTQVGLDLENEKIIYTKDFLDFLIDKQLKVVAPHTPIQTSVRLLKKKEELNCYCNLDLEMDFLSKSIFTDVSLSFGEKTYNRYLKYKDTIDKYFEVIPINQELINRFTENFFSQTDDGYGYYGTIKQFSRYIGICTQSASSVDEYLKRLSKKVDGNKLWIQIPKNNIKYIHINNNWEFKKYWELFNRDKTKTDLKKINTILEADKLDKQHYDYRSHIKSKLEVLNYLFDKSYVKLGDYNREMFLCTLLDNDGFYKCDFTAEHMATIKKFSNNHSGVWFKLPKTNVQFIYNEIRKLKSLANKKGDWVIGEFENWNYKEYHFEDFLTHLETKERELSKPLVDELDLSKFNIDFKELDVAAAYGLLNPDFEVEELNTPLKLKNEGKRMGHCVGGYSDSVKRGESRIFHINCMGIGSTIQIRSNNYMTVSVYNDSNESWRIGQHYGRYPQKGNLTPTEFNKFIGDELVKFLNKKFSKKEKVVAGKYPNSINVAEGRNEVFGQPIVEQYPF
jgi:hypothetical protein